MLHVSSGFDCARLDVRVFRQINRADAERFDDDHEQCWDDIQRQHGGDGQAVNR